MDYTMNIFDEPQILGLSFTAFQLEVAAFFNFKSSKCVHIYASADTKV